MKMNSHCTHEELISDRVEANRLMLRQLMFERALQSRPWRVCNADGMGNSSTYDCSLRFFSDVLQCSSEKVTLTMDYHMFQCIVWDVVRSMDTSAQHVFRPNASTIENAVKLQSADIIFTTAATFFDWLGVVSGRDITSISKQEFVSKG